MGNVYASYNIQPELTVTSSVTFVADNSGYLYRADPNGGTITITIPVVNQGVWFEVFKVSNGIVLFETSGGTTVRQTDLQISNIYGRIRVQMGPSNEWNIEGSLQSAPPVFPLNGTQYLRLENVSLSGSQINSMTDQIGSASPAQTGTARPTLGSGNGPGGIDSIEFNGIDQYLNRVALAATQVQPAFISMVLYIPSVSNTGRLLDDTPALITTGVFLNFGNIRGYNGGGGSWANEPFTGDAWITMTIVSDGASTAVKFGAGGYTVVGGGGNSGSNPITGFSIGAGSGGTGFAQFRLTDVVVGNGGQTEANAWHTYLKDLRGL